MKLIDILLDEKVSLIGKNDIILTELVKLPKDDIVPFIDSVIENIDKIHVSVLHSINFTFGNEIYMLFNIESVKVNIDQTEELNSKLAVIKKYVKENMYNEND